METTELKIICKICGNVLDVDHYFDAERMKSASICFDCDFWIEKWQMRDSPKVARIKGEHWVIGHQMDDAVVDPAKSLADMVKEYDSKLKHRGMGGEKYVIMFDDGRVVITDDLWHQGTIPQAFKLQMPDNAVFLEV